MPQVGAHGFVPGPIHRAAEAVHESQPRGGALGAGVVGMGVNPVLKRIDRGNPRKHGHDAFEMRAARTARLGRGVEFLDEFISQQLHAHGGDLAEFNGRAAIGEERFLARGQRVEGVAGLVEHRLHIALQAHGVHENEGQPRLGERGLITARSLALAVVEVEQMPLLHGAESIRQPAVNAVKDALRALDHLADAIEGLERRTIERVHRQVPRAQRRKLKLRAAHGLKFALERHDFALDGVMEGGTIPGRVIKTSAQLEGVVAVIGEAGIARDLPAQLHQLIEDVLELLALLQTTFGHQLPGLLSQGAVGFFEEAAHLREGFLLAAKLDGERAGKFLILLAQLGLFGFERDILLAEQLDALAQVAVEHLVTRLGQLRAQGLREVGLLQRELTRLDLRLDVLDEMEIGLLRLGAVGVAAHGDVTLRALFIERSGQFAPTEQGRLQLSHGRCARKFFLHGIEEWRERAPVAEINLSRHQLARGVDGQLSERQ